MVLFYSSGGGGGSTAAIVIFSLIGAAVASCLIYYCCCKEKKTPKTPVLHVTMGQSFSDGILALVGRFSCAHSTRVFHRLLQSGLCARIFPLINDDRPKLSGEMFLITESVPLKPIDHTGEKPPLDDESAPLYPVAPGADGLPYPPHQPGANPGSVQHPATAPYPPDYGNPPYPTEPGSIPYATNADTSPYPPEPGPESRPS